MTLAFLSYFKSIVSQPLQTVKKELKKVDIAKRQNDGLFNEDLYRYDHILWAVQEEVNIYNGRHQKIHRIFIRGPNAERYYNVGWVLAVDADFCSVCGTTFGMTTYKHHCRACGNCICSNCISEAIVDELDESCGLQKCCSQCCWGQEIVYAVHSYDKSAEKNASGSDIAKISNLADAVTVALSVCNTKTTEDEFRSAALQTLQNRKRQSVRNVSTGVRSDFSSNLTGAPVLVLITPLPGYVLKTYESVSHTKVFVNVMTSDLIAYFSSKSGTSTTNATAVAATADDAIYMAIGNLKDAKDKGNSASIVVDIVVNTNVIVRCNLDPTLLERNRLYKKIVSMLDIHRSLQVEPDLKLLNVVKNYKDSDADGVNISSMQIPSCPTYYTPYCPVYVSFKENVKAFAPISTADESSNSPVRANATRRVSTTGATTTSNHNALLSSSSTDRGSRRRFSTGTGTDNADSLYVTISDVIQQKDKSALDKFGKYIKHGLAGDKKQRNVRLDCMQHSSIKVRMIMGNLDAHQSTFTHLSSSKHIPLKDLIITPEPGYVIEADRPHDGYKFYINVCHHEDAGRIYNADYTYTDLQENDMMNHCTIGSIQHLPTIKSIALDLIIPTRMIMKCIEDTTPTGAFRVSITISLLAFVVDMGLKLGTAYGLPNIPGGYMCPQALQIMEMQNKSVRAKDATTHTAAAAAAIANDYIADIPQVFNICSSAATVDSTFLVFEGMLWKATDTQKSWEKRLFQLIGGKLRYYNSLGTFRGSFDVMFTDTTDTLIGGIDTPTGKGIHPFSIQTKETKDRYLNLYTTTDYNRSAWMFVLETQSRYIGCLSYLKNCPDKYCGWLKKEGHIFKNWYVYLYIYCNTYTYSNSSTNNVFIFSSILTGRSGSLSLTWVCCATTSMKARVMQSSVVIS